MSQVKVAVIGVGHLGKIHARIYAQCKDVKLVGLCDLNPETAKIQAANFKTDFYFNHKQLLGKVAAVSIATPTSEHFHIAWDFLKNNVHVLIEKPITTKVKEAERLVQLAQEKKLILQVGHVERFNPAIKTVLGICKNPKFIECHRLSPFPKRGTDVGVVLDLMIHDIDIILTLVKSPLKNCQGIGLNVLSAHEDIANARLVFKNGTVCNITASRVSDDVMRKIRIFQKDSYISLDYLWQKITVYKKKGKAISKEELLVIKKEPLVEELYSFIHCVKKNKPPLVCGEEAKQALQIALEITKQIRKK